MFLFPFCKLLDCNSSCFSCLSPSGWDWYRSLCQLPLDVGWRTTPTFEIVWGLPFALWLSLPCQVWICSPVVDLEACRSVSRLLFWFVIQGSWNWSTTTGREATEYFSSGPVHRGCDLLCSLSPVVWSHKVYCYWHCSCSLCNCAYVGNWLWLLSGHSLAQVHWDQVPGSTEIMFRVPLRSSPRTSVVMHLNLPWELYRQLRFCSGPPPGCTCIKDCRC